jgi:hypothetical protein
MDFVWEIAYNTGLVIMHLLTLVCMISTGYKVSKEIHNPYNDIPARVVASIFILSLMVSIVVLPIYWLGGFE